MGKKTNIHIQNSKGSLMIGFAIAAVVIAIAGAALAYFMSKGSNPDMAGPDLTDMNVTQASEGSVVPTTYGRCRVSGNIIWYGNVITTEEKEKAGGKGGGGSDKITIGYNYYIDIWQAICRGKAEIIQTYVQDEVKTPTAAATSFNDGTQSTYPTDPGQYANAINGVAHIFYDKLYLGMNVTFVPTIHFLVERDLSSVGVLYPELTKGANPAAIIYDILIEASALPVQINTASFNTAATYWNTKDYGLNIKFDKRTKAKQKIAEVLGFVGGAFGLDNDSKFIVKAFDPDDSSVATIDTEDFLEFTFARKTWFDTHNEFRANFTDETKDYTPRTIVARNAANAALQGRTKSMAIDLTAFRTIEKASERLWEVCKRESYPYASIKFKTTLAYYEVNIGQVVTINNNEYNIADAEFRVMTKDVTEVDKNIVGFTAEQVSETLFDDNFATGGGPGWTVPDYAPDKLIKQALYELPWNPYTGFDRAYIMLCARVNGWETGWESIISNTGTDYLSAGTFSGWAQYGTLDETYVITHTIDDTIGILYTPYREDPEFQTVTRTDLFAVNRYILIGNEIMRFQTVTVEGAGSIRLTGVVRGVLNTTPAQHNAAAPIWLFNLSENILTGLTSSDFYIKYLPYFKEEKVDPAVATAIHTTVIYNRAPTPWDITRIEGVRSGSDVTINWWPVGKTNAGAGYLSADAQTDAAPYVYDGDFEIYNSATGIGAVEVVDNTTWNESRAGAITYYVRARYQGFNGPWASVAVGSTDGTYDGPEI